MPPRRLLPLLILWCALVVLPGAIAAAAFHVDFYDPVGGALVAVWIVGFLAQLGVFIAVCQVSGRNNFAGWLIAALGPFVSDFVAPASHWGPIAAAVLSVGFACWFYWSCSRQADLTQHGIPAVGEVLAVKKPLMNMIINGAYIRRTLQIRVVRADGTPPYESKISGTFMFGEIPSPGDRMNLRIDPDNPQRLEAVDGADDSTGGSGGTDYLAGSPGGGVADELQHLADLHGAGQLSDAEFSAAKARLLSG